MNAHTPPAASPSPPVAEPVAHLLCLCAAWCHLCGAYAPVFEQVTQRLRADHPALRARWIDIEDEADIVGDLDIETFPTIAVLRGDRVLFFGAVAPQAEVLERVVRAALAASDDSAVGSGDPGIAALSRAVARLR